MIIILNDPRLLFVLLVLEVHENDFDMTYSHVSRVSSRAGSPIPMLAASFGACFTRKCSGGRAGPALGVTLATCAGVT